MKKSLSIISIVCLIALCFALFTSCAGNPSKVDDYVKKLNEKDDFYYFKNEVVGDNEKIIGTEIIVSQNTVKFYQKITTKYKDDAGKDQYKIETNDYRMVFNDESTRIYYKTDCPSGNHKDKEGKLLKEWVFKDVKASECSTIADARAFVRGEAALFDLKSENLVWNKDKKGFVYADGKAPLATAVLKDVVVTANSGELKVAYGVESLNAKVSISFMNFGSARGDTPMLCPDFAKENK